MDIIQKMDVDIPSSDYSDESSVATSSTGSKKKRDKMEENETGRFVCNECKKVLFSTKAVRIHKEKYHGKHHKIRDGKYVRLCSLCKCKIYTVASKENLQIDEMKWPSVICESCRLEHYPSVDHISNAGSCTDEHGFICTDCGRWFDTSRGLKAHARIHEEFMKCKCEKCEKRFQCVKDFIEHCDQCEVKLKKEYNLKCQECDKLFSKVKKLQKHMNKEHMSLLQDGDNFQTDKLRLQCARSDCGAIFFDKDWFKKHQYVHQYLLYECQNCNLLLSNLRTYRRHCKGCNNASK